MMPHSFLQQARNAYSAKQFDLAYQAFSAHLQHEPACVEALHFCAQWLLQHRQFEQALPLLEQYVAGDSENVAAHQLLAQCLENCLSQSGDTTLIAVLATQPAAYTTRLAYAAWLQHQQNMSDTVLHYVRALNDAQQAGFWQSEDSTPPWLRASVKAAFACVQKYRWESFGNLLEPLKKQYENSDLKRVEQCLQNYLGIKRFAPTDARQRPSFLYFPGLPTSDVIDRHLLPYANWLEAQTDAIRDEMLQVLNSKDVQGFHTYDDPKQAEHLFRGAAWDAYFFYRHGQDYAQHLQQCPHTAAVLQQLPLIRIPRQSPETCYSILRPGTHILPHRGVTNIRSVLHLPLVMPDDCALNITNGTCHTWHLGECFAFDDSFEHEAWNRSEQTRVILLTDIWNPHLTDVEQAAMTQIIVALDEFNQKLAEIG